MYELYLKYVKEMFPDIGKMYLFMFLLNIMFGYILAKLNYSLVMSIAVDLLLINIVENKIIQKYADYIGMNESIELKKNILGDVMSNKLLISKDLVGITLGWIIGNMKK
jgi:hypothetical protein